MNYPELMLNNDIEEYYNESLPSSWSSHSSFHDYQAFHQPFFSPNFLDSLKQDNQQFMLDDPVLPNVQPSIINTHHSPISTTISSPTSNYDNNNLFYPILEEDKNLTHSCPSQENTNMRHSIQRYLSTKQDERKVTILTSRVAQKSYNTEKRFLCPPPSTILSGIWWTQYPPNLTIHITGEKSSHHGVIDWYKDGMMLDPSSAAHQAKNNLLTGNCVSKQLHISDTDDKRKKVQVQVEIMSGEGTPLGVFHSKPIKVISKPSKKRQSPRNTDLCIHHGTTIALFNRMRAQTVSTKYLGVSSNLAQEGGTCFVTRTTSWDPFLIWIVDLSRPPGAPSSTKPNPDNPQYPPIPTMAIPQTDQPMALHYNQPIVLQCISTGLVSPVMIIRRVDKGSMVMGGNHVDDLSYATGGECGDEALGDPVSQLHKVAFQIVQDISTAQYNKTQPNPFFSSMSDWSLPQTSHDISYLAGMNDIVCMHRVSGRRSIVSPYEDIACKRRLSYQHQSLPKKPRRRVNSLNDIVTRHAGRCCPSMNGDCWTEDVSDAATWTLVGTDSATFTFVSNSHTSIVPRVESIQTSGSTFSLVGEGFSRLLSVWLGDVLCTVDCPTDQYMSCAVPERNELLNSLSTQLDPDTQKHKVPIILAHQDGSIYNSQLYYFF